ncbi:unnamed protein product [Peronospora belbahrii]|uniref:Uncharacterized protein n=1 Tax=Peronospora belbahrii TaxID=622444 RepID=A0ABN8CMG5_9STRA|nr:unnamed protein product [Peronospora belbahrii]
MPSSGIVSTPTAQMSAPGVKLEQSRNEALEKIMFAKPLLSHVSCSFNVAMWAKDVIMAWDGLVKVGKEEGLTAFFEAAKLLGKEFKNDLKPVAILPRGGFASASSWGIIFPVDVLKSRMQTASSTNPLSLRCAFRAVYSEFGIHGFYRGWSAAVLRAFPANGSLFLGVEMIHRVLRWFDASHTTSKQAGLVSCPLD